MEQRKHIDDICIGDRFMDNDLLYDVVRFHGENYVFCECQDEKSDSYFIRGEDLRKQINKFNETKVTQGKI